MKVERSIEIAASPEAVYEVIMDPAQLGDWVTIHDSLVHAPNGQLEKGDELEQKLKIAGQGFKVSWKVVTAHRPHDIEWEGRGPMGTKARVSYDLPGGPLGKVGAKAFQKTAAKEADRTLVNLKGLLER